MNIDKLLTENFSDEDIKRELSLPDEYRNGELELVRSVDDQFYEEKSK